MLTATLRLRYNGDVQVRKPTRRRGQDLRDLPIYTIGEASTALAIPTRTFSSWFLGPHRVYKPAFESGPYSLLSFRDAAEAYRLYVLREIHGMHPFRIRQFLERLRAESRSTHPLLDLDLRITPKSMFLVKPSRVGRQGYTLDLSGKNQLAIRQVIETFAKRIVMEGRRPIRILPWRHFSTDPESTPVSLDPDVMSGNLVVIGTRVPVSLLKGMRSSGRTDGEIAQAYRLTPDQVTKALLHFARPTIQKVA